MPETLGSLGERRIISDLLALRYGSHVEHFGDDCAAIPHVGGYLIVTTDPCPPPMAMQVGFSDPFYRGWLLATINLSDLAAAGARPLGVLTSLQLPADTKVRDFERLLDGIDQCCSRHGAAVIGGNLKEAPAVDVSATAFGWSDTPPIGRAGAQDGDLVLVLGPLGLFWAGVLALRNGLITTDAELPLLRTVLRPDPQLSVGIALRRERLASSVIDCSDGLWPSLAQIADASGLRIVVEPSSWTYSPGVDGTATNLDVDPARLALGWGDWQLICTCRPEHLDDAVGVAAAANCEVHQIGRCEQGTGIMVAADGELSPLLALDSQRFAPDSWFSAGIDAYIDRMLHAPFAESAV